MNLEYAEERGYCTVGREITIRATKLVLAYSSITNRHVPRIYIHETRIPESIRFKVCRA